MKMKRKLLVPILLLGFATKGICQQQIKEVKFSQPLYLDLPGDLNVKKGYKEINVLNAYQSFTEYKYYRLSAEYAFAPINN